MTSVREDGWVRVWDPFVRLFHWCLVLSFAVAWLSANTWENVHAWAGYAAGGLIDLEFIAQYLQLVHASRLPEILDTSTARVLDKAWQLQVLPVEDAEVLRPAVALYNDLTQILRLCLAGPFDPKTAGAGLLRLLARAADVPDFATLDVTLIETQAKVRASFVRILGKAP